MDRAEAVSQLIPVFRRYGYEGATLARISEATGLGRASLYHHFPQGKQEMAAAVLKSVDQWFKSTVLDPLHRSGPPKERLQLMADHLLQFYNLGQDSCLLAVFSVGEAHDLFDRQVQQALSTWIVALEQVLLDAGFAPSVAHQRAEDTVILVQGAVILTRGLQNTDPFERVVKGLPTTLLG